MFKQITTPVFNLYIVVLPLTVLVVCPQQKIFQHLTVQLESTNAIVPGHAFLVVMFVMVIMTVLMAVMSISAVSIVLNIYIKAALAIVK